MDILNARFCSRLVSLTLFATAFVGQAHAAYDSNDLTVDETAGPAKVRMLERWHTPATGMAMSMPTIASTGNDGSIKMSQQKSVISVAANTTIEVLEGPVPGLPMQRVVQDRGSAFYDIAPRGDNKLRVEASYLVAVVKGTQFNVSVDNDTTTIALFEGSLQIEAPNVGDVVDIYAGQIAKFHRDDQRISIIDMTSGELLVRNAGGSGSGSGSGSTNIAGAAMVNLYAGPAITTGVGSIAVAGDGLVSLDLQSTALSTTAGIDLGLASAATSFAANLDLGSGVAGIDLGSDVSIAGLDLGVGVDTGIDLGAGEIDLGVEVGSIDVGVDLDLDILGDVGETLTGDIDSLLVDTGTGLDDLAEDIDELLPDLGDLLPDPGDLLGL